MLAQSQPEARHLAGSALAEISECPYSLACFHYPGGVSVNVSDVAGSTQGPHERASKLSSAMRLVLEIERARQTQPQRARLASAVEAALADFLLVAENAGVNVIHRRIRDCEVAVSVQAWAQLFSFAWTISSVAQPQAMP